MPNFRFPGSDDRTTIIGATGSGKTVCGMWMLSHQRLDARPWVILDFKREVMVDQIGFPPLQDIDVIDPPPKKHGVFVLTPRPGEEEGLEGFLWRLWENGNCGLYVDEAALMPDAGAWRAILQQGRSKRIPVIACSQRPVDVTRAVFSEASFFCIYRVTDRRDQKTIEGFAPLNLSEQLPPYHWRWYDVARNNSLRMGPVPKAAETVAKLRESIPFERSFFRTLFNNEPARVR